MVYNSPIFSPGRNPTSPACSHVPPDRALDGLWFEVSTLNGLPELLFSDDVLGRLGPTPSFTGFVSLKRYMRGFYNEFPKVFYL